MTPPKKKSPSPRRPVIKAPRENFIGHESATMLDAETFEEFERRMKDKPAGATQAVPVHSPNEEAAPDDPPTGVGEPQKNEPEDFDEDLLPDEYEG